MRDCIFCEIVRGEAKAWKVFEDDQVTAFLDIFPVSQYHTLVIPKAHYENIFDTPQAALDAVMAGVRQVLHLYQRKLGLAHVHILNNSGRAAQQEVFHLHFHIIPRQPGDGKNIRWEKHPEWVSEYDRMVEPLR